MLVAGAAACVAMVVAVCVLRMRYPFELEWLEGLVLEHVQRVLHGRAIYVRPSIEFIPLNYTPLYVWVGAAVSKALGEGFFALRLVSFVSAMCAFALLFELARRETGRWVAGAIAAGLFAATFRLSGAWLDVARADSLHLALILAGVFALRADRTTTRAAIAAGALFALAFFAKQTAVVVIAPLVLWMVVAEPRRAAALVATTGVLIGGGILALDRTTEGWFRYYAFDVARRHTMDLGLLAIFPVRDLLVPLGIAVGVAVAGLVLRLRAGGRDGAGFHVALFAGLAGSAWLLRLYPGGYDNVLVPAYAGLALITALAWAAIADLPPGRSVASWGDLATLALLLQLALLRWSPAAQLPAAEDRARGERIVELIRRVDGPVLVTSHAWLAPKAGKPSTFHVMPFMDVVKGGNGPIERELVAELHRAAAQRYAAMVLDTKDWLIDEAHANAYAVDTVFFENPEGFWPVTGMRTRPEAIVLRPRAAALDTANTAPADSTR